MTEPLNVELAHAIITEQKRQIAIYKENTKNLFEIIEVLLNYTPAFIHTSAVAERIKSLRSKVDAL